MSEYSDSIRNLSTLFSEMAEPKIGAILVHRNPNGMSCRLSFFVVHGGIIKNISYMVSRICSKRYHEKDNSVIIPGCGFGALSATIQELEHEMGININHYKI